MLLRLFILWIHTHHAHNTVQRNNHHRFLFGTNGTVTNLVPTDTPGTPLRAPPPTSSFSKVSTFVLQQVGKYPTFEI